MKHDIVTQLYNASATVSKWVDEPNILTEAAEEILKLRHERDEAIKTVAAFIHKERGIAIDNLDEIDGQRGQLE